MTTSDDDPEQGLRHALGGDPDGEGGESDSLAWGSIGSSSTDGVAEALLARFEAHRARSPELTDEESRGYLVAFERARSEAAATGGASFERLTVAQVRIERALGGDEGALFLLIEALTEFPESEVLFAQLAEVVRGAADDLSLESMIYELPRTPEHARLIERLWRLANEPREALPAFDQPVLGSAEEVPAFFAELRAMRERGEGAEAVFRYRAAFGGYPGLPESKRAVEEDPIPLPEGFRFRR
ncbi:hypothetical protein [Chondromyces crocatus]|uniref:Uncharacterized protein n=1 Tax=Chondromyces crocatus TaxID=52 RepID=A0A0K1EHX0_CHOCO|nr:hypothetical protein [Chondromyces crocatus]AKT40455.1 uncharacterized protein CMC5_046100 [Chondromyces crocatus]